MKKITFVYSLPSKHIPNTTFTKACNDSEVEIVQTELLSKAHHFGILIAPDCVLVEDFSVETC